MTEIHLRLLEELKKTVNVIEFQHYGRTNERIVNKQRKFKIQNWEGREVIFIRDLTIEAM